MMMEERVEIESAPRPSFEFYVTDHSANPAKDRSREELKELYLDVKKDGITSVRYDWNWRDVEAAPGKYNRGVLGHYQEAAEAMAEAGLSAPTIILSNPPAWAVELYKSDKEQFFLAYQRYVDQVKDCLLKLPTGEKISRIQILNELNNSIYTPIALEDIPRLCQITRETMSEYNPEIKLVGTVIADKLQTKVADRLGLGEGIEDFLVKLKTIAKYFDSIAVDYYPGVWRVPLKEIFGIDEDLKREMRDLDLLQKVFEEIATWGKEYEVGEVGFPSNSPWRSERLQRYFYDVFFRTFRKMMMEMREKGLPLPSRIGLYQAVDNAPSSRTGKILRKTPWPEHDFGLRDKSGRRKHILQKNLPRENQESDPSRLKWLIDYLNNLPDPISKPPALEP
ncbi:MAG: hypothetical protein WC640_02860 [Candidatus Paceibacterota bacterium]|jgi:hypothetical protein